MIFHSFTISDCEDPEIYAAHPLWEWEKSDQGCWVMQHCANTSYTIHPDPNNWGYRVIVFGDLSDEDATYFTLKYK